MRSVAFLATLLVAGCADPPRQSGAAAQVISLDGVVSADEWNNPPPVPAVGDVLVRLDDRFVYLGVRSNATMPVHVYLAGVRDGRDEVHVLHASASLGRAVYRREAGGAWVLAEPFAWELLDPALAGDPDASSLESERAAYRERTGWAASTMLTGTPGETEFAIDRRYLKGFDAYAVSYIRILPDSTDEIRHWPTSVEITPREYDLLMGETIPADFTSTRWAPTERLLEE